MEIYGSTFKCNRFVRMIQTWKSVILVNWVILWLMTPVYSAVDKPEQKAKTYFEQKQYDQALTTWYAMVDQGHSSAGLYFNIGVAESILHNVPEAILAYEQSLRLNPLNKVIKTAIVEERKKIENATIPVAPFFLSEWYKAIVTFFRPGWWAMIGVIMMCIGLLSLLAAQMSITSNQFLRPVVRTWLIISGVIFILMACLAYKEIYRKDEAILLVKSEIRQAADVNSPIVRTLYPGEKIRITDEIGNWYNVELLNLEAGWIEKEKFKLVEIRK
jgi:tetratricopeptide (TPR) repeat protein